MKNWKQIGHLEVEGLINDPSFCEMLDEIDTIGKEVKREMFMYSFVER